MAWVYILDTAVNAIYTTAFGLEVYLASTASEGTGSPTSMSLSGVAAESVERE